MYTEGDKKAGPIVLENNPNDSVGTSGSALLITTVSSHRLYSQYQDGTSELTVLSTAVHLSMPYTSAA